MTPPRPSPASPNLQNLPSPPPSSSFRVLDDDHPLYCTLRTRLRCEVRGAGGKLQVRVEGGEGKTKTFMCHL